MNCKPLNQRRQLIFKLKTNLHFRSSSCNSNYLHCSMTYKASKTITATLKIYTTSLHKLFRNWICSWMIKNKTSASCLQWMSLKTTTFNSYWAIFRKCWGLLWFIEKCSSPSQQSTTIKLLRMFITLKCKCLSRPFLNQSFSIFIRQTLTKHLSKAKLLSTRECNQVLSQRFTINQGLVLISLLWQPSTIFHNKTRTEVQDRINYWWR